MSNKPKSTPKRAAKKTTATRPSKKTTKSKEVKESKTKNVKAPKEEELDVSKLEKSIPVSAKFPAPESEAPASKPEKDSKPKKEETKDNDPATEVIEESKKVDKKPAKPAKPAKLDVASWLSEAGVEFDAATVEEVNEAKDKGKVVAIYKDSADVPRVAITDLDCSQREDVKSIAAEYHPISFLHEQK